MQHILRSGIAMPSRSRAQVVNSLCKGFIKGVSSGGLYKRVRKQDQEGETPKDGVVPRHLSDMLGRAREHTLLFSLPTFS